MFAFLELARLIEMIAWLIWRSVSWLEPEHRVAGPPSDKLEGALAERPEQYIH